MNPYVTQLSRNFGIPRIHAWLDREALSRFAKETALKELASPSWREEVFPEDDFEFVEFSGWANTINFYFTDIVTKEKFRTLWPECRFCRQNAALYHKVDERTYRCIAHDAEAKILGGSFAMAACLRRAVRDDAIPINKAEFLRGRDWTDELARFVFRGMSAGGVIPLLRARYSLLHESAVTLEDYGDEWLNVFKLSSFKAFDHGRGAVERLAQDFVSFRDEYLPCEGQPWWWLPFFKRAHLLVQMYEGRARSSSLLRRIKDPEFLILPADYELPKAFRAIGALRYSPELLQKILAQEEVEEGGRMEVELRLSVVEAGELLEEEINVIRKTHHLSPYTKVEIDYLLWTMGKNCKEPHHLTYTTRY